MNENKKRIILWIEDDLIISTILGNQLVTAGFDLLHVNNADEAFSHLKNVVPNLIVLDLMLAGIKGFQVLENIRKDEKLVNVPVIILSNIGSEADMQKAESLGVKKFMIKSTSSIEEILQAVKTTCN